MATGTDLLHQSVSFFDAANPALQSAILQAQANPNDPQVSALDSATGLLLPDISIARRTDHFPDDLYDLRPESHLMRFLKAMLGDSGTGQLRKRYQVARQQSALTSTHFFDLDRFYGALFGAQRNPSEQLPLDPYDDTATPDEWDQIRSLDSTYRERIMRLAKAIPMGATVPGMITAAEAITGVECDLYETWSLLDAFGEPDVPPGSDDGTYVGLSGRTWDEVEADYPTWDSLGFDTWAEVEGITDIDLGGISSATPSRSRFVIRPKKDYDTLTDDPAENARIRAQEEYDLLRVLNVLKPANMLLTIDSGGIALHIPTQISRLVADSEFWQVTAQVRPRPTFTSVRTLNPRLYPVSRMALRAAPTQAAKDALQAEAHVLPLPPFVTAQGEVISYNAEIVSANSYAQNPDQSLASDTDFERVTFYGGQQVAYGPSKSFTDARQVLAGRYASEGVLVAHPYSGTRTAVASLD